MDRDPFGHRKYHGMYFVLGFLIAFVAFMMLSGCDSGKTTAGTDYPPVCCQALAPECMAQCEGIPVTEWVENTCGSNALGAEYAYWDEVNNKPIWLCEGEIIN